METNIQKLSLEEILNVISDRFCDISQSEYNELNYYDWKRAQDMIQSLQNISAKHHI